MSAPVQALVWLAALGVALWLFGAPGLWLVLAAAAWLSWRFGRPLRRGPRPPSSWLWRASWGRGRRRG